MKKKMIGICTAFIICIMAAGIVNAQKPWPESVDNYISGIEKKIKTADMESFKAIYDKKEFDVVVDVRERNEYTSGHVPGAVNVPRGVLEFMIWRQLGYPDTNEVDIKNKKIYLYCHTGARATLSAKTLKDLGFKNVVAVIMDISQWEKAGYPVDKGGIQ